MRAVHLRVVKLEGDGQCGAQEAAPVSAPDEEGGAYIQASSPWSAQRQPWALK